MPPKAEVKRVLGPDIPKARSSTEMDEAEKQREKDIVAKGGKYVPQLGELPPVIRSVLELSVQQMTVVSKGMKSCPGSLGGLFYKGKPYCYGCGYRDSARVQDFEETGNHMKIKDPILMHQLSIPIITAMLCQMSDEGVMGFDTPLSECIPELGEDFRDVTPRHVLAYRSVLDEGKILKDCGATNPMLVAFTRMNISKAFGTSVYDPIAKFFAVGTSSASIAPPSHSHAGAGSTPAALSAAASALAEAANFQAAKSHRAAFVQYLIASKLKMQKQVPYRSCRVSHFSLALLVACMDRRASAASAGGFTCFEHYTREKLFIPIESKAAGYGPPRQYRDPSEMFYRPIGFSNGHHSYGVPVLHGSPANCAPPLFNASLNMYSPCDEFSKVLLVSIDSIICARKHLKPLSSIDGDKEGVPLPTRFYDLGVLVDTKKEQLRLEESFFTNGRTLDVLPYSAAVIHSVKTDVTGFAINNCGSRKARAHVNMMCSVLRYNFAKHVLSVGADAEQMRDPGVQKKDEPVNEAHDSLMKEKKKNEKIDLVRNASAHTRF